MEGLDKLRIDIDQCDKEIVSLIEKRFDIVSKIMETKKQMGLPVYHPGREEEVIKKVIKEVKDPRYQEVVKSIYRQILDTSKTYQSKNLFPYNVVLIGFMGAGKSIVGRCLSQSLGMDIFDIDDLIKIRLNSSIAKIFENHGEDYFRNIERETIAEISKQKNAVISCGGGAVLINSNVNNLKENGKVFWLKAQPETIFQRIKDDDSRPLLRDKMNLSHITALLSERWAKYKSVADYTIETDTYSVEEICDNIIKLLVTS
ncbi:chorismate mutase [Alkaliphilus serpentinus]|uniref:Shikimate kinase n=1 Tax=Alkaliphilus serpentinus TaxID=1482731 RepID=A0A833HLW1_9FIRM|nr:chorismate mutase [Alkaliphilus serpentinus]KAB3526743.1 chorismate mutase [Alkaliphilus serpentinus]